MATLAADGCQALDVCSGQRCVPALGQLRQKVFSQLGEEGGATAGHQVAKSQDGAFPDCHPGAGQLR